MLDKISAILVIEKHGGVDWRPPVVLHGTLPDTIDVALLQEASADKPALRKMGAGLAVILPQRAGAWVVWLLDVVPPVTALPDLVDRLTRLTRDLYGAGGSPVQAEKGITDLMLPRLAKSEKRDLASVAQMLADACVETGLARFALVADIRGGKVRRLFASDMRLMTWSDELRLIVRQHLAKDRTTLDLLRADLSMGGLDGALLNDMAGSDMIRLDLPGKTGGLGLILFDPKGLPDDLGAMVQALGTLAMGRKPPMAARRKYLRAGLAVAGLALAVWLVLPAPLVVTATAVSEPRGAVAMALPVPGFVDAVQVRVGDRVMAGDPIARFRAPDLEEQIAALGIELTMEQVVAQTALSTNDYGAFLLSQQKIESATQRQARLQDRLAQLDMRADVAGRVVSAMGPDSTGRFVPMGETIAILQPEASFAVGLTVSRVDAPLLTRGQQGQVWFRGLSNRSWAIETETPVVLQNMGGNGEDQLTLQARVLDVDQQALFAGLAGFARIEVGQQVRARVLSRYATEWVRGKAWIWFGLTF